MRSISIGVEPIAAASLNPTPQTVSDGSFAQSLQDTVDMGGAVSQQPVQSGELQQTAPTAENPQAVQENQPLENPQAAQETQPQQQVSDGSETQQTDRETGFMIPLASEEITGPDSDLLKELEDLLGSTEEMLSAPERMKETIKDMILQAYQELNDPEVSEEEFTEMVLDFLMKYIQEKFGGKTEEDSSVTDDSEDRDETDVNDVLLQVVVQMLDEIRSENVQTQQPEDEEAVDGIPSTEAIDETAAVTHIEPLTDESQLQHIPEGFSYETDEAYINAADTEFVQADTAVQETETPSEDVPEVIPETAPETAPEENRNEESVYSPEIYQAAMQTAENIYNAIVQEYQPQQPLDQARQPEADDKIGGETGVFPMDPADELEELNQLVKGGETVEEAEKSEPEPDLGNNQSAAPTEPTVVFEIADGAVTFESAIISSIPETTHSAPIEGSGAERVITQIVTEIFNQLPENGGTTTFVMTLNPESLGRVTVKLVEEAGKISVSVTAHEKRAVEILTQRFDTLQTAMKENGTQLEKYQVVYAPEEDERAGQQNFDGSSKNPYVKQDDEEGEDNGEFAEILQQAV